MDINERFDLLDRRMSTLEVRMDALDARMGKLEARMDRNDERLAKLEQDLAVIKSNYATKADLSDTRNSIVLWVVSAFILSQVLPHLLGAFGVK